MTNNGDQGNSRKRKTPCKDDCCEFTPISKRINNIHICNSNSSLLNGHQQENGNCRQDEAQQQLHQWQQQQMNGGAADCHQQQQYLAHQPDLAVNGGMYQPDLDAMANPHYYHINELLHELHFGRIHRTGGKM